MTINIVKSNKVNYTFPKHMTKLIIIDQKEKKNDKTNFHTIISLAPPPSPYVSLSLRLFFYSLNLIVTIFSS